MKNGYFKLDKRPDGTYLIIYPPEDMGAPVDGTEIVNYLDGFKLQILSQLITPSGKWNMASTELYYLAAGEDHDPGHDIAAAVQALTVDDIIAAVPAVREAFEGMGTAMIAGADEIESAKDIFDKIYKLK